MMRLLFMLAGAALMPMAATAQSLAIVHAKAWTMLSATPVSNATILVEGGRILSVREAGSVPPGVRVIDAAGMPVTPGFMNAATQIGLIEVLAAEETRDTAAPAEKDTGRGALGPSFDISFALNGNSALVALARADGMTSALSFPSLSAIAPFAGQAAIVRLRAGADILGRARAAMFVVIGGGAWDNAAESRAAQWQLLRAALDEARAPHPVTGGEESLLNRRDAAAVRPVLAGTVPLAIVTHRESDIREAIRLAAEYRIRVVIVGGAEAWRAAADLAAAHIPVVLDPEANLPASFDQLGARQDNAAILATAGVTIAFGLAGGVLEQDYNAGLALREGAGLAVAGGLPYVEALKAVTVNPAAIWGVGRTGTMAARSDADLVIWDGDPFEPSTGATTVIVEGKSVSLDTRQSELQRRYAPAAP